MEKALIYSPENLRSRDKNRHLEIGEAYQLVSSQEDRGLPVTRLKEAIKRGEIRVYTFGGHQYLDRLDMGRVYAQPQKTGGMTFSRGFSTEGEDPLESAGEYKVMPVVINDNQGNERFRMDDTEFPNSPLWADRTANTVIAQKYFFRPDRPEWKDKLKQKIGSDHEYSVKHLITRTTNFFADSGWNLGYFKTEADREAFRDDLMWLQIQRVMAFNSPVQFNAGLFNEYGIGGSRGVNFFRDPKTGEVRRIEDGCYVHPQSHACFIKGPRDDLESICQHAGDEAAIFSLGSGVGQDIGVLREKGARLSSGGEASGPLSFVKIYDDHAGTIKSGGKSRRAARMTTMRYDHPDSMDFIRMKVGEDRKALLLMKEGYSRGMDGEAVTTVTFQNTNFSVRLDDYFFKQLDKGGDVELRSVTDGRVVGKVPAKRMLQEISFGSWRIGDPAVQYDSRIQEDHTCKNSGKQSSSNPCSEYMFVDDTSCNLASINLARLSDDRGNFKVRDYEKAIRVIVTAQDIANSGSSYPVESIARISPEFRTIGIGFANLGTLVMRRGVGYDSEQGRALAGALTAILTGKAYETSAELSNKLGSFTHFRFNRKPMLKVMHNHQSRLDNVNWNLVPADIKDAAYKSWNSVTRRRVVNPRGPGAKKYEAR